jgi:hypothetical protein
MLAKLAWRYSWLITLPVAALYLYWGWQTAQRFYAFKVRYNSSPMDLKLIDLGATEFHHLVRRGKLSLSLTARRNLANDHGLKKIILFVPTSGLAQLDSNLPHSGFQYIRGRLWDDGKLRKMKFRYRGDFLYHWGRHKKSLRVKMKKPRLYDGMRTLNLIAPKFKEQLNNYLGYRLAARMGVLAPRTELVNVILNGETCGVHVLVEQLGEQTLRYNHRMPGDLYSGDLVGDDGYIGLTNLLFEHPGFWDKRAVNNHYPAESRKPIERLIELVNALQSEAVQRELSELLDLEAWGRFSAFETLAQSVHSDAYHNWRIYFDPARSRFVPVVWDPTGWIYREKTPFQPDILATRLHERLFENGDFLRARHRAIERFFSQAADERFLSETDEAIAIIESSLTWDPDIHPIDPSLIVKGMRRFRQTMNRAFSETHREFLARTGSVAYVSGSHDGVIPISVSGRRPVERLQLNYREPHQAPVSTWLRYWRNGQEVQTDISAAVAQSGARLEVSTSLLPRLVPVFPVGVDKWGRYAKVRTAYYELGFEGIDPENRLLEVLAERGGGATERAERVEQLERRSFGDRYAICHPRPVKRPLVWRGEVKIEEVREIEDVLILEPGTTVRLASGAGLIVRNKLIAEGTADEPIRFLPATEGQPPWGALVVVGPRATGSVFQHCEFAGGSGLKGDLFEFSAMFSIHDVAGVNVESCRFHDSRLVDDMVHAVYADVHFRDCEFARAPFDALDLDVCRAVIERCHFSDNGNDAVDLMTTEAVVADTWFERNGDKGISVGEESRLLAVNDCFVENQIGVQAKDGSVAVLYNVDLNGNRHALDAYRKIMWYESGGRIFVYKARVLNNDKTMTAGKRSRIRVHDSYFDRHTPAERVEVDETVDSRERTVAIRQELWRFPDEIAQLKEVGRAYWKTAHPQRRGSTNVTR